MNTENEIIGSVEFASSAFDLPTKPLQLSSWSMVRDITHSYPTYEQLYSVPTVERSSVLTIKLIDVSSQDLELLKNWCENFTKSPTDSCNITVNLADEKSETKTF